MVANSLNIPSFNTTAVVGTGTGFSSLAYNAASGTSNLVSRDSNGNSYFNSSISGYATTVTSGGLSSIAVDSAQQQYFTGSATQTLFMPVTSTLVLGQTYTITNNSSGVVTVQSSGGNTIQAMAANTQLVLTVILTSGTTAASWSISYTQSTSGVTFTGDAGTPFFTNSVTIAALPLSTNRAGASVSFNATGTSLNLITTDSTLNTYVGRGSGGVPAGAANNTGFGYNSLAFNQFGANNVAIGGSALQNISDGTFNCCIGDSAGATNTGTDSHNVYINNVGVTGESNALHIGAGTGTGQQQLSTAYISGMSNTTLAAVSPTPYLILQDIVSDQLSCPTPVAADAASTAFGSLSVGTALQNTSNYPILVNVSMAITVSTTAVILVGIGPTNTPTAQAVTASFTVAAATPYGFSFVVPSQYYAKVTTTGTITVGSITTFASQIG